MQLFNTRNPLFLVGTLTLLVCPTLHRPSQNWIDSLPQEIQASVLWCADHEEGTLSDWEFDGNQATNGGGIFTTGKVGEAVAEIIQAQPFSGNFCVKTRISNAFQSKHGNKAVRLMRWTDKPWDQGGTFFPQTAYYGTWMRLDHDYSIQNPANTSGGWWNVFQFKSKDREGDSKPVWVLNIDNDPRTGKMYFYLYSKINRPSSYSQAKPVPIPVGQWFHLEAFYNQSTQGHSDGSISIWQNGDLILQAENVETILDQPVVWGIGNYTDHISGGAKPGTATIYFDDATVSTKPLHPFAAEKLNPRP